MEPEKLTSIKATLEERLELLIGREAALSNHLRGTDGRLQEDFSDRVAFTEMDEVIEQLDDTARAEILSIRTALKRIDLGTYGVCVSCGDDIAAGRLLAVPSTTQCVACAAKSA